MDKDKKILERIMAYERFYDILSEKEITPYKISQQTGIATSTLSDWKNGKSMPKQDKMQKIAEILDTTVEYLTTGKEPQIDYLYNDENADFLIEITKMSKDKNFVDRMKRYMSLLDADKKSIDDMIDFMYSKNNQGEA